MNTFLLFMILPFCVCVCVWVCIYRFYSIKPSHFTEANIYVKFEPKAGNTAQSYHLKSGAISSQWNYLFIKNCKQTLNKIMKNQDENKSRNTIYDSH